MIGAIIGDIAGSRFERASHKSKEFELFDRKCRPTDDSVMSLAVAKAILESEGNTEALSEKAIACMQELGRLYPNAGYGGTFRKWIQADDPKPYNSYGNGSAMRVSPCGFAAGSLDEAKELSALVTKVSHDHPEGMKGAEAIAVAVYMAKTGESKDAIREFIEENYYKLDFTIDGICKDYKFDVSCQESVPVALEAFLESTDFEDAVRTAISVGGDSDTIGAMAGSVAEAFYGVPEGIVYDAIDFLDARQMEILYYFEKKYSSKVVDEDGHPTIELFDVLDAAVDKIIPAGTTIEVDDEYPDDSVHGYADKDAMVPDFSSFDEQNKPDIGDEIIGLIGKASSGVFKIAKEAREDVLSATKNIMNSQTYEEAEVENLKQNDFSDNSILEMFGLTYEQSLLMFSAQKLIAEHDKRLTKSESKAALKEKWIAEWEQGIATYLDNIDKERECKLLTRTELQERFKTELEKSNNRTWYYITALELSEFVPYTPLGGDNDKDYSKCKFDEKKGYDFVLDLLLEHGCLSEQAIERLDKTYTKSMSQISGKTGKLVTKVMIVVAVGAVAAAFAAIAAGPIAVALFGESFVDLTGAALTNACLALAGGGAIAAGGTGIAGGVATIAAGGALLGLAGGGTAVGIGSAFMLSAPEYTLTQAAKLETILKEVVLNALQDVVCAQKIIARYQEQIEELNKQLTKMELEDEKNKKDIKNIKICIKYLKKSCKDMNAFASAYEVGLQTEA